MGLIELYRTTGDAHYLALARRLIELRDHVAGGTDQNQDRVPFNAMTGAIGHAVRANYLYAGVADLVAETGDPERFATLRRIARDVYERKLYITGATGALYDGASPDGSADHAAIDLVAQAYGRDYQLPNLTAYNESCATVGYVLWTWRMFALTGDARFADLVEQSLYNGVLAGVSLDGTRFFYSNPLRKLHDFTWPLRWSRDRQANIPDSFCCPPNLVRTIAEAQDYIYSLSPGRALGEPLRRQHARHGVERRRADQAAAGHRLPVERRGAAHHRRGAGAAGRAAACASPAGRIRARPPSGSTAGRWRARRSPAPISR